MSRHAELERQIAELRERLYELERRSTGAQADAPLPTEGEITVVVCRSREARVALPLEDVERVVPLARTDPLPESPPWVQGLLRYGGRAVPVLDLVSRLTRRAREIDLDEVIVLCRDQGALVGLVVQEVTQVRPFPLGQVADAPRAANVPHGPYVRATLQDTEGLVWLLSVRRLVATSDLPALDEEPSA